MFDNVGYKLKMVAKVTCWIGIIASCISGIVLLLQGNILIGLLSAGAGSLSFWLMSLGLYAFGELVENSDILANIAAKHDIEREAEKNKPAEQPSAPPISYSQPVYSQYSPSQSVSTQPPQPSSAQPSEPPVYPTNPQSSSAPAPYTQVPPVHVNTVQPSPSDSSSPERKRRYRDPSNI